VKSRAEQCVLQDAMKVSIGLNVGIRCVCIGVCEHEYESPHSLIQSLLAPNLTLLG